VQLNLEFTSIFIISLEPTLSKIPEKIHSPRPAARRRERQPASQKNFLFIFYFARAVFFILKGKENFSASASALKTRSGEASLRLAGKNWGSLRGRKFLPAAGKFCFRQQKNRTNRKQQKINEKLS